MIKICTFFSYRIGTLPSQIDDEWLSEALLLKLLHLDNKIEGNYYDNKG